MKRMRYIRMIALVGIFLAMTVLSGCRARVGVGVNVSVPAPWGHVSVGTGTGWHGGPRW